MNATSNKFDQGAQPIIFLAIFADLVLKLEWLTQLFQVSIHPSLSSVPTDNRKRFKKMPTVLS